jgi:hypothetical protein
MYGDNNFEHVDIIIFQIHEIIFNMIITTILH